MADDHHLWPFDWQKHTNHQISKYPIFKEAHIPNRTHLVLVNSTIWGYLGCVWKWGKPEIAH
jgi:hypothetical protein